MSKNTITRAQAIELAIHVLSNTHEDWDGRPLEDAMEVLKKMHEQLVKPRAKAVSKARLANEGLAKKLAKQLAPEGNTSKEIVGFGLPEVATTQKAAAVMRVAEELGLAEKVKDGKRIAYKPVAQAE